MKKMDIDNTQIRCPQTSGLLTWLKADPNTKLRRTKSVVPTVIFKQVNEDRERVNKLELKLFQQEKLLDFKMR
jgi:hypothetical protein